MILIAYSSCGGNTEIVANKVYSILENKKTEVSLKRVEIIKEDDLLSADIIILACPTYFQGDLEKNFANFIKNKLLPLKNKLIKTKFTIIGLGSSLYYSEYLTESATILEKILKDNNLLQFLPSLRINGNPNKYLDTLVFKWTEKIFLDI